MRSTGNGLRVTIVAALAVCASAVDGDPLRFPHATGTETYWAGGTGNWNVESNWDPAMPGPDDTAVLGEEGYPVGTVTVNTDVGTVGGLNVHDFAPGELRIAGGCLDVAGEASVEGGSTASLADATFAVESMAVRDSGSLFVQDGGQANIGGTLRIQGDPEPYSEHGAYQIKGGTLSVAGEIDIGAYGRLDWYGGTIDTPRIRLDAGAMVGESYLVLHSDFDVRNVLSGDIFGSGGTEIETVSGKILVTDGATATHMAGSAEAYGFQVGEGETSAAMQVRAGSNLDIHQVVVRCGEFRQEGGLVDAWDGVYLDNLAGESATYDMEAGLLHTGGLIVGSNWRGGKGTFRQTGGRITADNLYVARNTGSTGTYELTDGRIDVERRSHVGPVHTSHTGVEGGRFVQKGGIYAAGRILFLEGTYTLEGGRVEGRWLDVGRFGAGRFVQKGGETDWGKVTVTNKNKGGPWPVSTVRISGGTFSADSLSLGFWSDEGPCRLEIHGGEATITLGSLWQSNGVLETTIDPSGLSVIDVSGDAKVAGVQWEIVDDGAPLGRFDVLQADGEFSWAAIPQLPGPDWSWGIEGGKTLWVRHVPEPASTALLGVGWAVVMSRRRRRG